MHDRHNHDRMIPDNPLAGALRDLPAQSPPHDGWPGLAARVRRRRRTRRGLRVAIPVAIAAAIAVVVLVPLQRTARHASPPAITSTPSGVAPADNVQVVALRKRSQRLQSLVQQLRTGGPPLSGGGLAIAANLQDRIGVVDLQLNTSPTTAVESRLWHQRIDLLRQLALVRVAAGHPDVYARARRRPMSRHPTRTN